MVWASGQGALSSACPGLVSGYVDLCVICVWSVWLVIRIAM